MVYRCPYCKHQLGAELTPRCPQCNRTMLVPSMKDSSPRYTRRRKLEQIRRESEQQKAELRSPPTGILMRTPAFYFGTIIIMAAIGTALFHSAERAQARKVELPQQRAMRHLDALAEALGRYRFHVGTFPTAEQGLAALILDPGEPGWLGPYINQLRPDPWQTPYTYQPQDSNTLPLLFSYGPDCQPDTPDDIHAVASRFDPGTEWTNGWVSADKRWPKIYTEEKK